MNQLIKLNDLLYINQKNDLLYVNAERHLLIPSSSFGVLQRDLIDNIGMERMKSFFFKHGWNLGTDDAKEIMKNTSMSLEEKISYIPVFHSNKGHVKATIMEKDLQMEQGRVTSFRLKGVWEDSYEAEQHIHNLGYTDHPICYTLTGYASGAISLLFGEKVFFKEIQCKGTGASHCVWEGRLLSEWDEEVVEGIFYRKELPILKELEQTNAKLLHEKNNLSLVMEMEQELTDRVAKGINIKEMLDIVQKQIKVPVVVEDLYQQVVLVRGMTKEEYEPIKKDFFAFIKTEAPIQTIAKIQHAECMRLVSPIYLQEKIVGYCSFLYKDKTCQYEIDSMLINRVSSVCSVILLNEKVKLESTERMKGYFFEEIMNGKYRSEQAIMSKAFFIDLDFTGGYYAIHLKYTVSNKQQKLNPTLHNEIYESVTKYMSDKGIHVLIGEKTDSLLLLLPVKQLGERKVEYIIYPFMTYLRKRLHDTFWFAGISSMHNRVIDEVKDAFKEAHTAVKLSSTDTPITFFHELGILGVLVNDENRVAIKKLAAFTLGDLYKNLDQSKAELIGTLYAFLTNGGNFEQTAEQLAISISGLRYRLNKITNLLGGDLRDPERRFQLLLSLKALIVLNDEWLEIEQ
ncbi:helix-turn-helix domain-containing protein [Bacillus tuaregi]|uniref:helix-turn-helix domain-containing protein n=1 Tax=Bacillus tuaregi TaxID=1816695 RepID=UPI0008F84436|nr:helix-turn-helix domain-containing protein [Bacillus tuaregi]